MPERRTRANTFANQPKHDVRRALKRLGGLAGKAIDEERLSGRELELVELFVGHLCEPSAGPHQDRAVAATKNLMASSVFVQQARQLPIFAAVDALLNEPQNKRLSSALAAQQDRWINCAKAVTQAVRLGRYAEMPALREAFEGVDGQALLEYLKFSASGANRLMDTFGPSKIQRIQAIFPEIKPTDFSAATSGIDAGPSLSGL